MSEIIVIRTMISQFSPLSKKNLTLGYLDHLIRSMSHYRINWVQISFFSFQMHSEDTKIHLEVKKIIKNGVYGQFYIFTMIFFIIIILVQLRGNLVFNKIQKKIS